MTSATKTIPFIRGLPLVGSLLDFQKDRMGFLHRISQEHGDIVSFQLGPLQFVLLNSPALVTELLVDHASKTFSGSLSEGFKPIIGVNALPLLTGSVHLQQRRLHAPAFQHKRLLGYTESMVDFTDDLLKGLRDGAEVEVDELMLRLTRRIIVKTLFNLDDETGDFASFAQALRTVEDFNEYATSTVLRAPLSWPTPRNRKTLAAIALIRKKAQALIDEVRARGTDTGDLLSMLILARDEDGAALTDEQLRDHTVTMYLGGHETTSVGLAWTWKLLSDNPEVRDRLQQELDSVLGGRKPQYSDLANLPYTAQVVKESLRILPPGHLFSRSPLEDIEVGGYRLAKGVNILVSPYTLHRMPQYFPEPERFDPSRFSPEKEKSLPRNAYLPFGVGPHVCIGAHFAVMEMNLILAHMAQHVEFNILPDQSIRALPLITLKPSSARAQVRLRQQESVAQPALVASGG